MLDSIPVPWQALIWPLLGATLILMGRRFLPNWVRRLVALAATLASLRVLWSLRAGSIEQIEVLWEPLNLFRMSPMLHPDGLALLVAITLAWFTAATVLGVRGAQPRSTAWHGLVLIALAGCLAMTMATNLMTLAMASALLDFALIAMTVLESHDANRTVWRMAVPGVIGTLLLATSALLMDALVGTGSLSAQEIPSAVLTLAGVAGMLRLLVYPLHARGLHAPENAASTVLAAGAGIYIIARVQSIDPTFASLEWMLTVGGVALLAGGILSWTGSAPANGKAGQPVQPHSRTPEELASNPQGKGAIGQRSEGSQHPMLARIWSGTAVHQAGLALAYLLLVRDPVPWPLFSLSLALGMMVIWWDSKRERASGTKSQGVALSIQGWWARIRPTMAGRSLTMGRFARAILPTLALGSLAGIPLTAGARGRWILYGTLRGEAQTSLLIALIVADSLLVAGLAAGFRIGLRRSGSWRPSPATVAAMLALAVPLVILGIAPGALGVAPTQLPEVSALGLGLLYVLPWILGVWLARTGERIGSYLPPIYRLADLGWLFGAVGWLGQRLGEAVFWVGQVGEGRGWFGWILVILALGVMLLIVR